MNEYLIAVSSFCIGIVAVCISLIFVFGYKVKSTRYHVLFWCSILFYLICQLLNLINLAPSYFIQTNLFIPVFYIFFISVYHFEKFKKKFLLLLLLPIIFFIIIQLTGYSIIIPIYHLIIWSVIITITLLFVKRDDIEKKDSYFNIKLIIIILIAIAPFIIISLIMFFIFKKDINGFILFPSLAITIIIEMFFIYNNSLIILNFRYFENLEMIKRQAAYEKKSIIEKLSQALIHEIKNPLSGIQSLAEQISSKKEKLSMEKIVLYSSLIEEETKRIKEMTNSYLLTFKKNNNNNYSETNIENEIKPVLKLIENTNKNKAISIKTSFNGQSTAYIDSGSFRQIMLNLLYNSIEANATEIKIISSNADNYIDLRIIDNGEGINETYKDKIFNTFFSTKNEGAGIGLSICKEVLNQYEGNIELINSNKDNTEFKVLIKKI